MPLVLRNYQQELVTAVRNSVMAGNRRVLMVGSTGLGKTAILFEISKLAVENAKNKFTRISGKNILT